MNTTQPDLGKKQKCEEVDIDFPAQHQNRQPGFEFEMDPRPVSEDAGYMGSGKLKDKVAVITGGDSGIGRAVAYAFAKEGADVMIPYFDEHQDAQETKARIEQLGRRCTIFAGDLKQEETAQAVVAETIKNFGKIDILVNNHAVQYIQKSILDITAAQLDETFRTNIYAFFYMTKVVLPHLKKGSAIINTTSVTAYHGNQELLDYSSTKGAIVSFTRSLSLMLVAQGIRVNGVAPGPIWTPLIPSSFSAQDVETFGAEAKSDPMQHAGQPCQVAPCYVFLASGDSSYMTGQILHPNGGNIVGS